MSDEPKTFQQNPDGRWVPAKPLQPSPLIRLEIRLRRLVHKLRGAR